MTSALQRARERAQEMERALQAHASTHTAARVLSRFEESDTSVQANGLLAGHAIMYSLNATLAKLDTDTYFRSKDQRLIQHRIMAALSRKVYGKLLASHEAEIRRYNGFTRLDQHIIVTAPRRGGKTTAIVQMVSAILLCIPRISVVAFASNSRAAGDDSGLMGQVKKCLQDKFGVRSFKKDNKETLIHQVSATDERVFHAYPGGATHK